MHSWINKAKVKKWWVDIERKTQIEKSLVKKTKNTAHVGSQAFKAFNNHLQSYILRCDLEEENCEKTLEKIFYI